MSETPPWIGKLTAAQRGEKLARASGFVIPVSIYVEAIRDAEALAREEFRGRVVQLLLSDLTREEARAIIGKLNQSPPEPTLGG